MKRIRGIFIDWLLLSLMLALLLAAALPAGAIYFPKAAGDRALPADAAQDFTLTLHDAVTQKQVDRTLIRLEQGVKNFAVLTDASPLEPIRGVTG